MRPVSGDDLVTAALQSSLARAQKNFNHHKQVKGAFGGKLGKLKKEEVLPIFNANSNKGKGLKFQSEFDLWREQASQFTFTSEGLYTNGASIPEDIECLNASSKSVRNSVKGPLSSLQSRNGSGDASTYLKPGAKNSSVKVENSFELLKKLKENRKEKKKFLKLRKRLLKEGYSVLETDNRIDQAKGSNSGVGANSEKSRNGVSADKEGVKDSAILKQQLIRKNKDSKSNMRDMSENEDSTTSAVRPRPSTPSGQPRSLGSNPSPSSTNGGTSSSNNGPNQHQLPLPKRVLYPRDKIVPGYTEKMPVGAGFFNMGNSCYLNASLQAVFHVPAFINWLKHDAEHRKNCQDNVNCIVCAMKKTLDSAMGRSNPNSSAIRPVEIINRLRSICRHFSHGRQEDAHEFLRYLFESMERSYLAAINCLRIDNRSKETNPLGQIFGGYIRTEVTCLKCHYVSTTFQPTAELQLDIRHVTTLEDAILNHFKKERLDNNDYRCEKCRTISQATKQFSLEVPPIVLCLQLKRFTLYGTKIAKRIHCNQYLDMSKFIHKSKQLNGFSNLRYRLAALVTHLGSSPNCGHYTAIAQASNGSFYQFDDSFVHQVSLSNALNNDAYVIIYEMDTKGKKSPEPSQKTASSSSAGYNGTVNKLGYPSSTASASNSPSTSINQLFPKKLPSTPIPKIAPLHPTSKLVQNNETEGKQGGLPVSESTSSGAANGRIVSNSGLKPTMDRKMISFGIRPNNAGGNKINILKPGVSLTNSSKLVPASSGSTNNVTNTHASPSLRTENKSDPVIKLVPYNDDENEESDKDENLRAPALSNNKRLNSPENHRKQSPKSSNSELPVTPPKSPKPPNPETRSPSTTQSSVGNSFKKGNQSSTDTLHTVSTGTSSSTKSEESTHRKDTNTRKPPENGETHNRKSRSNKRRSSSASSSSGSESESSAAGRGNTSSQNKRKRDEEVARSSPEKKSSSYHSSTDHGNPRDSAERDEERRKNRNPSRGRSRSPSADRRENRGSSSGSGPKPSESDSSGGGKFDGSSLKQENSILGWNGQKSVLSRSMEEDRKRSNDKSLDEEYDDEFDQGRTKKIRRSRSLPRETESGGNRFQNVEDKKKKMEDWNSLVNGYNGGGALRRNSSGGGSVGAGESKNWFNGGNNDPARHKRNFSRSSSNSGSRPRHSSSNGSHAGTSYSQNSHGRSPFRNGHHNNGGGGHYRSQSQNAYHSGTKHWGGDRNRR